MGERSAMGGILRQLEGISFQVSVFKVRFLFHIFVVRWGKRREMLCHIDRVARGL